MRCESPSPSWKEVFKGFPNKSSIEPYQRFWVTADESAVVIPPPCGCDSDESVEPRVFSLSGDAQMPYYSLGATHGLSWRGGAGTTTGGYWVKLASNTLHADSSSDGYCAKNSVPGGWAGLNAIAIKRDMEPTEPPRLLTSPCPESAWSWLMATPSMCAKQTLKP